MNLKQFKFHIGGYAVTHQAGMGRVFTDLARRKHIPACYFGNRPSWTHLDVEAPLQVHMVA